MQEYLAKIRQKNMLTDDMVELVLSIPDNFSYQAGQFVQLYVPTEEKTVMRSYSISSSPNDQNLTFCIKLVPGGKASTYLSATTAGNEIKIRGPLGHFNVEPTAEAHYFIATGAGIAPIISMIRNELEGIKSTKKITLLFGVRYEKDIVFADKLQKLAEEFPNFSYKICLTRPEKNWSGACGRVTEHISELIPGQCYYLCGSMEMVKDAREILLNNGVDAKMIRMEIF